MEERLTSITQIIVERKVKAIQIIKDASHDQLKANLGMTVQESFEGRVPTSPVIHPVNSPRRI
jgi:hypothetical protein